MVQTVHLANQRGWAPPTVTQALYNIISRAVETELLPMVNAYGLGTCMYNPLAGGLLTGKQVSAKKRIHKPGWPTTPPIERVTGTTASAQLRTRSARLPARLAAAPSSWHFGLCWIIPRLMSP
ncbi:MAG: hypothetical protein CM1200mP18_07080 [Gammaproteobacteria bacterium]|nr:MAG: hypothetical protein CM1200mP18_07080 [Gammaproteobacteria bacterium]